MHDHLALIENDQVVFSAIYNFVNDELYHATRGGGAFLNDEPIHVSNRLLRQAYVGWEMALEKEEDLKKYLWLKENCGLVELHCSGYEFSLVAQGKLDGSICLDPFGQDYDFAPGTLLVEEAGGVVANIGQNGFDYKNHDFIAANSAVFEALTKEEGAIFPIR